MAGTFAGSARGPLARPAALETPIEAAVRGIAAGVAATFLLTAGSRVVATVRDQIRRGATEPPGTSPALGAPGDGAAGGDGRDAEQDRDGRTGRDVRQDADPTAPEPPPKPAAVRSHNPTNPEHLRAMQAARHERGGGPPPAQMGGPGAPQGPQPVITPAGALVERQTAGTEDLAEELAYKIAAGVFDRDISSYLPVARFAMHMSWGAAAGLVYGLLQGSYDWPVVRSGLLFGLAVWLVGPASLAPAMKLMRPVRQEPPSHTAMLVAGHLTYGVLLARAFELLRLRRGR